MDAASSSKSRRIDIDVLAGTRLPVGYENPQPFGNCFQ
jgi:hypothetical protein